MTSIQKNTTDTFSEKLNTFQKLTYLVIALSIGIIAPALGQAYLKTSGAVNFKIQPSATVIVDGNLTIGFSTNRPAVFDEFRACKQSREPQSLFNFPLTTTGQLGYPRPSSSTI